MKLMLMISITALMLLMGLGHLLIKSPALADVSLENFGIFNIACSGH